MSDEKLKNILNTYMGADVFAKTLALPSQYIGEEIVECIPNVAMGPAGPTFESYYIFTNNFMCEVRMSPNNDWDFDVVRRNTIKNIRLNRRQHTIVADESVTRTYSTIEIQLIHSENFVSSIRYTGAELDHWLSVVLTTVPATSLVP